MMISRTGGFLAATALAGLASTAACASGEPPALPRAVPHACKITAPGVRLECGTLHVRADRADPANTATMKLEYVIIKSRAAKPDATPALFLTGGPGSSALYFLNVLARVPVLDARDIVVIEQRGNGYSEPNLLCDGEKAKSAEQLVASCYAEVTKRGAPVNAFNITESAHDLADLRTALGVSRWNVMGTSYGTFWGLHYARLHPGDIRSLVLDSPWPPQANPDESWRGHLNGLSAVFAACKAQPACDAAYPQLRDRFVTEMKALSVKPFAMKGASFGAKDLMSLAYNVNFETASVRYVPRLIDAALKRDFKTLGAISAVDPYGKPKGFDIRKSYSIGLNIGMPCIDDAAFAATGPQTLELAESWPEEVQKAAIDGVELKSALCRYWPVNRADAVMNEPVSSDLPTLVIAGEFDPETPPALGVQMASTLRNSTLLLRPDAAHATLSVSNACVSGILNAFLADPSIRPDISCAASQRVTFSLPGEPIAAGAQ